MTKKIVSNIMQLSKAMAAMTSVATALCYAAKDELKLNNVSADYLDGVLALAKEMSIHADIIYDVVIDERDDMDETAKIYIKANRAKLAAVTDELESIVDKLMKKESENNEKMMMAYLVLLMMALQ